MTEPPHKTENPDNSASLKIVFPIPQKNYVVGTLKNRLNETVL